LPAKTQSKT